MKRIILIFLLACSFIFANENEKLKVTGSVGTELFRDHPFQSDGYNNIGSMFYGTLEFNETYNVMLGYANNSFGNKINYVATTVNFGKIYFAGMSYIRGYSKHETLRDSEGIHYIRVPFTNNDNETFAPIFGIQHRLAEKVVCRGMMMGSAFSVTIELGLF